MLSEKINYLPLFLWLCVIYLAGLFVPLMDNDSAHHANIALHMYRTGDYVNLIDQENDYLDKPHLLFWLTALSYHLFGVTTFAYKFPSLLFSLLGLYATFRLGERLYSREAGKLATAILATAFAFILANNDVRMDAILTACIVFAIWQFVHFTDTQHWRAMLGGCAALALAFATKGMIGMAVPAFAILIHLSWRRRWSMLFNWRWLLVPIVTLVFISPVLYCYYLQFDLHPEKVVRMNTGISGVKFILWSQNFERLQGSNFGSSAGDDPFFFLHTFLWAFLPWSILALIVLWKRTQRAFIKSKQHIAPKEMLTTGTILIMLVILSLAGFKLPHYLNILFPLFAIATAGYLTRPHGGRHIKSLFIVQVVVAILMILFALIVNVWLFPIQNFFVIAGVLLVAITFYFQIRHCTRMNTVLIVSLYAAALANFLFNTNYYPQLLNYQAGNNLARVIREQNISPDSLYYLEGYERSNSFDFYTARLTPTRKMEELIDTHEPIFLYTGENGLTVLKERNIRYRKIATHSSYRVSEPKGKFFNRETRKLVLAQHYVVEVR